MCDGRASRSTSCRALLVVIILSHAVNANAREFNLVDDTSIPTAVVDDARHVVDMAEAQLCESFREISINASTKS